MYSLRSIVLFWGIDIFGHSRRIHFTQFSKKDKEDLEIFMSKYLGNYGKKKQNIRFATSSAQSYKSAFKLESFNML